MKNGLEHSLASAANAIITNNMSRGIVSGKVRTYNSSFHCHYNYVIILLECVTVFN